MDYIRRNDPFRRTITIHAPQTPALPLDAKLPVDVHMLETNHNGYNGLVPHMKSIKTAMDLGALPLINGEVCYEGIYGSCYADIQRYVFFTDILMGCCGHTYGAHGIWQANTREEPYGISPYGYSWGDTPWEEAYRLSGSEQTGNAKRFLCRFEWWRFEPHPEWIENPCTYEALDGNICAGIPKEARFVYLPVMGGNYAGGAKLYGLDGPYHAYYYDMISDRITDIGLAAPNAQGDWKSPNTTIYQDWVLALTKRPLQGI